MKFTITNCFDAVRDDKKKSHCPFCVELHGLYDEYSCNLSGRRIELTEDEDILYPAGICPVCTVEVKMPVKAKEYFL